MPVQIHNIPKAPAASKSRRPVLALFAWFVVRLAFIRQAKRVIPIKTNDKNKIIIDIDSGNLLLMIVLIKRVINYMYLLM